MKKNIALILYTIVFCIICFLKNWYKDIILFHLTIIIDFLLDVSLLITFIILLRMSIATLKNEKNKILKILPIIILVISLFLSFNDFRLTKTKLELNLFEKQRNQIIEEIKDNNLKYYYGQNIKLPIYKYVSSDGEVYVYQNNDEQVIGFWIFRGMISESIELIYSSLDEELIYTNKSKNDIIKIIKLKEHWYYVVTDY